MDHSQATEQMMTERYLLDELSPEEREAFEEHVFDCPECALDLRAGSAFITEAKAQLPELVSQSSSAAPQPVRPGTKKRGWSFWLQPAFAVPVFAILVAVIAYQNISLIPGLEKDSVAPRILHSTAIHIGTRGSPHTPITADRTEGLALSFELPQASDYTSFVFELYDPRGKQVWTHDVTGSTAGDDGILSLVIPGAGLEEGSYILVMSGVTQPNQRVEVDRRILDIQFSH